MKTIIHVLTSKFAKFGFIVWSLTSVKSIDFNRPNSAFCNNWMITREFNLNVLNLHHIVHRQQHISNIPIADFNLYKISSSNATFGYVLFISCALCSSKFHQSADEFAQLLSISSFQDEKGREVSTRDTIHSHKIFEAFRVICFISINISRIFDGRITAFQIMAFRSIIHDLWDT